MVIAINTLYSLPGVLKGGDFALRPAFQLQPSALISVFSAFEIRQRVAHHKSPGDIAAVANLNDSASVAEPGS